MSTTGTTERLSLLEQRQEFIEQTVLKHMKDEEACH